MKKTSGEPGLFGMMVGAIRLFLGLGLSKKEALQSPKNAMYHVIHDLKSQRFLEGEALIATDSQTAYLYAVEVVKARWPEGEKAIAASPQYSYLYAVNVIQGRFKEGEPAIVSHSIVCGDYDKFLRREHDLKSYQGNWNMLDVMRKSPEKDARSHEV